MYVLLASDHFKLYQFAGLEFEFLFLKKKKPSDVEKNQPQKRYTYKAAYNGCKIKITAGLNVSVLFTKLKKIGSHNIKHANPGCE